MKSYKKIIATIGLTLLYIVGHLTDAQVSTVVVTQTRTNQPVVTITQTSTSNVQAPSNTSNDTVDSNVTVITTTSTSTGSPLRTSSPKPTPTGESSNKSDTKTLIISGSVVGGVVVLAFVGILLFRFHKNKDDWGDGSDGVLNPGRNPFKDNLDQYHRSH